MMKGTLKLCPGKQGSFWTLKMPLVMHPYCDSECPPRATRYSLEKKECRKPSLPPENEAWIQKQS